MKYSKLGNSEDLISVIGFGTGFHLPENESGTSIEQTIKASLDNGVNFVDTAPVYGDGASEKLLGETLLKIGRKNVFLASKVSPKDVTHDGVIKSCEASLSRLQTDVIDLLQVHWSNPNIPLSETLSGMEKLVSDGKVRHIGVSNFTFNEVEQTISNLKNTTLSSIQTEYNLFERSIEEKLLPYCVDNDITLIAYSPLAQGKLANGKNQVDLLHKISKKYNCTPGQVVLNWLTAQSRVVVIPNTSKEKRAIENAKSTNFNLSPEDLKLIDENLKTPVSYVDVNEIKVSNDYNRKVYTTVQEALDNKMNLTPSPVQLAEEMKKGFFLKPIRLKQIQDNRYDLIEGRLRYWAWVIAFGNSKKIPALVWKK